MATNPYYSELYSCQQEQINHLPNRLLNQIKQGALLAEEIIKELGPDYPIEFEEKIKNKSESNSIEIVKFFSQKGLYTLWLPKFLGGGGWHPLSLYSFNKRMSSYCLGLANIIGSHYVGCSLISSTGKFSILKKIISEIYQHESRGEVATLSAAVTEPMAGTDLEDPELLRRAKVVTSAKKVDGGYLLRGQKIFISNSANARWHVVTAYEDLSKPADSTVIALVDAKSKGVQIGRTESKLGQTASLASVIFFEDVFVPDDSIALSASQFSSNQAYQKFSQCVLHDVIASSRAGVAAMSAGVLDSLVILTKKHITETSKDSQLQNKQWVQAAFGKILKNQKIASTIAWEANVQVFSSGQMKDLQKKFTFYFLDFSPAFFLKNVFGNYFNTKNASQIYRNKRIKDWNTGAEKNMSSWGSLSKVVCSDLAMDSSFMCLELIGFENHKSSLEIQKIIRDVKLLQIYEGTNEFNLLLIYKNHPNDINQQSNVFSESVQ